MNSTALRHARYNPATPHAPLPGAPLPADFWTTRPGQGHHNGGYAPPAGERIPSPATARRMAEDPKLDKIAIKDRRLAKIATVLAIAALVVLCLCAPTIIGFLAEELLKIVCWCIKTPVMLIFNVLTGRGVTF